MKEKAWYMYSSFNKREDLHLRRRVLFQVPIKNVVYQIQNNFSQALMAK